MMKLRLQIAACLLAPLVLFFALAKAAAQTPNPASKTYFKAPMTLHCNTTEVVAKIAEKDKRHLRGTGITPDGNFLLQVWVNDKGEFTFTSTRRDKKSCILGVGEDWQFENAPLGDPT